MNSLIVFPSVLAAFAHEEPGHWLVRRTSLEHDTIRDIVSALRALFANSLSVRHLRLICKWFRRLFLPLQFLHNLSIQQILVGARSTKESGLPSFVDKEHVSAIWAEQH